MADGDIGDAHGEATTFGVVSCRQPMPTAHVLRMNHVGLGGQQLDKVQVALEAASSRVQQLDLSSELQGKLHISGHKVQQTSCR